MRNRPEALSAVIGRIVADVIAARHARTEKGARQVAARRARHLKIREPLHAPVSHGGTP